MVYRAIGIMSGSSLDGLDIAFVEFNEQGGKWDYEIKVAACHEYDENWKSKLQKAITLNALDYQLLHVDFGHYIGQEVSRFIEEQQLHYQVSLIASHGHTTFHLPGRKMTAQLGDGAAIAAETGLPVVSDLRAMDVAFGGQGAPIVPIGEKMLMPGYDYFLNIGGIANISRNADNYIAFDVCPANRVLNMLANDAGREFDEDGKMAESGSLNKELLQQLNDLDYYRQSFPKSLANDFGTDVIYTMIKVAGLSVNDALHTYTEHIAEQINHTVIALGNGAVNSQLLVTGGGAFNKFLMQRLSARLEESGITVVVPDAGLVKFKEALIMAFIGVLRWRQENNVLSSVTGSARDSIGGALWTGQDA